MADIWLIRHGQAGDILGDYDRLSDRGRVQCRSAGERWGHLAPVHHVITGSMRRHKASAAAFAETFTALPDPVIDPGWDEFDYLSIVQKAIAAGLELPVGGGRAAFMEFFLEATTRWTSGDHDSDYPESYTAFRGRVSGALDRAIAQVGAGETALVFTSGGAISAVCGRLLELRPRVSLGLATVLVNSSFTRVRVGAGLASLASMNVHSHLDGQPELITLT